jgi:hypothetical protein
MNKVCFCASFLAQGMLARWAASGRNHNVAAQITVVCDRQGAAYTTDQPLFRYPTRLQGCTSGLVALSLQT